MVYVHVDGVVGQEWSTMRLVSARAASLALGGEWAGAALALAERYVRNEPRRAVRLHAFQALVAFIRRNRSVYSQCVLRRRWCTPPD